MKNMELKKDYLNNVAGKLTEVEVYNDDLNRTQAKEFDQQFCILLTILTAKPLTKQGGTINTIT